MEEPSLLGNSSIVDDIVGIYMSFLNTPVPTPQMKYSGSSEASKPGTKLPPNVIVNENTKLNVTLKLRIKTM